MDYIGSPTSIMVLAGIKRTIKNALGSAPAGGMSSENPGELVKMIDEFLPSEDFLAFQRWAYQVDCCKTRADYQWAKKIIVEHQLSERCTVLMGSVYGRLDLAQLAHWIVEDALPVRMQVQIHKVIWEPTARGV